jgi:hypothetical protein
MSEITSGRLVRVLVDFAAVAVERRGLADVAFLRADGRVLVRVGIVCSPRHVGSVFDQRSLTAGDYPASTRVPSTANRETNGLLARPRVRHMRCG